MSDSSAARLRLRMRNESALARLPRAKLRTLLAGAHAARSTQDAALNLLVVDDENIARMNARFKRHQGPTDVLAFPDGDHDPRAGGLQLGDVVVSAETARREAESRRAERPDWTASDELCLYALHGLLHLLGHDDADPEDARAMRQAQQAEFARHNWPRPPD